MSVRDEVKKVNMEIFNKIARRDHEQVCFFNDKATGLKAIVAIHDTRLGPALGGCRFWDYQSEKEALYDVLRLSRAMTYKAAIAGLNLGGGKSVIFGNPKTDKNEAKLRAFGRFIEGLSGRYITAEDVGTSIEDMEYVRYETVYVTGLDRSMGGGGDPSPVTAQGVHYGIKACVKYKFGRDWIKGMKVAIQGLGHVGMELARLLYGDGAILYVSDIDQERVDHACRDYKAIELCGEEIYKAPVEIFAPCALGAVINDETISELRCSIIAGSANNQLESNEKHGNKLKDQEILYAPDYVINSGGLINAANEFEGYSQRRAFQATRGIYHTLLRLMTFAERENISTCAASDYLAEERLKMAENLGKIYKPRIWGREYFHTQNRPSRS